MNNCGHRDIPALGQVFKAERRERYRVRPWWPDLGLVDRLRDPVEVAEGEVRQGPFCYEITDVGPDLVGALYRGLADNSVGRVIENMLRNDLVIIDEVGFAPPG